jgi:foldase protein PrsA
LLAVLLAAVLALVAGCGKSLDGRHDIPGAGKGEVVAIYDGGNVTRSEFDKYKGLNQLVNPMLALYMSIPEFEEGFLRQYVLTKHLTGQVTDAQWEEAEKQASEFRGQLKSTIKEQPALKEELDAAGLTVEEAVAIFKRLVAYQGMISARQAELESAVTEEELRAEFGKAPQDFNVATVRHVLIATVDSQTGEEKRTEEEALQLAREVKDKLVKGADWNEIAREYSDDPESKDNGGLYENQKTGIWVDAFKNAANTQPIGVIGDPVKTEYGYHVIKVESRTEASFEKLSEEDLALLRENLAYAKLEEFLTAEEDKLGISVVLPQEPDDSPSASPGSSPTASSQ